MKAAKFFVAALIVSTMLAAPVVSASTENQSILGLGNHKHDINERQIVGLQPAYNSGDAVNGTASTLNTGANYAADQCRVKANRTLGFFKFAGCIGGNRNTMGADSEEHRFFASRLNDRGEKSHEMVAFQKSDEKLVFQDGPESNSDGEIVIVKDYGKGLRGTRWPMLREPPTSIPSHHKQHCSAKVKMLT